MLINVVTIPISTLRAIVVSEMVYVNFYPTNVARVFICSWPDYRCRIQLGLSVA